MIRGSKAVRICPKVLPLIAVVGFCGRKLFVMLYASARTSNRCASRTWKARESAASNCHVPGPTTLARPTFPSVPRAGIANAAEFGSYPTDPQICPETDLPVFDLRSDLQFRSMPGPYRKLW